MTRNPFTDSKDEDSDNEDNSEEDEIQAAMRNPFDLLNEDEWTAQTGNSNLGIPTALQISTLVMIKIQIYFQATTVCYTNTNIFYHE